MLIRGGENIYCVEVENALYDHPAVMDAAVIGIPHKHARRGAGRGRAPEAGRRGDRGGAPRTSSRERLAAFKVPVKILFWPETLPRNANGKIMKNELKKLFVEE